MFTTDFITGFLFSLCVTLMTFGVITLLWLPPGPFSSRGRQQNKISSTPYLAWPAIITAGLFLIVLFLLHELNIDVLNESAWFEYSEGRRTNSPEGIRNLFLTLGGAIATPIAALTLGNAIRRSATMERQEEIARKMQQNDSRRLESDAFAKASELLGSNRLDQRIAAVHSLQLLARSVSEEVVDQISDTLCAFVRARSSDIPETPADEKNPDEAIRSALLALLGQFADGTREIDIRGAWIGTLVVTSNIKRVSFAGTQIKKITFLGDVIDCKFENIKNDASIRFAKNASNLMIANCDLGSLQISSPPRSVGFRTVGGAISIIASLVKELRIGNVLFEKPLEADVSIFGRVSIFRAKGLVQSRFSNIGLGWPVKAHLPSEWSSSEKAAFSENARKFDPLPMALARSHVHDLLEIEHPDTKA
ncbi:hypothetical protein D1224_04295 [Henriciella barbarensis]|uniref:Pentapeptide repeat-containing protein n=1 Tax=Henriciella barbarensis TaxID=86342 RepID=A0A399QX43_9PROT|nr:hypothetical protein [Henriciella barbarensis]RIJ23490.1 hypothetical protein D1224_04295 [Henriciella barbarensis]